MFSFLAIASLVISHKGTTCSYEYNRTVGKMQENARQNLPISHNLLTLRSYQKGDVFWLTRKGETPFVMAFCVMLLFICSLAYCLFALLCCKL